MNDNNFDEEIIIVNSLEIPEVKSISNNESNIVEKGMYMFYLSIILYICVNFFISI